MAGKRPVTQRSIEILPSGHGLLRKRQPRTSRNDAPLPPTAMPLPFRLTDATD